MLRVENKRIFGQDYALIHLDEMAMKTAIQKVYTSIMVFNRIGYSPKRKWNKERINGLDMKPLTMLTRTLTALTKTKPEEEMVGTTKEASITSKKVSERQASSSAELIKYFKCHCGFDQREATKYLDLIPKQCMKPTKTLPMTYYMINQLAASKFSDMIKADSPDINCPVLELNPGLGLVTSKLFNSLNFQYVSALEHTLSMSQNLSNQYNVHVFNYGLDALPRMYHIDKIDGGDRINAFLTNIRVSTVGKRLKKGSCNQLYVIGTLPHISLVQFLLRSYASRRVLYEEDLPWKGVTLYVALGSKPYTLITATPETGYVTYRPSSVLFQTLFKYKVLGDLPRQAFIPWERYDQRIKGSRKMKVVDPNVCKVMKIEINLETIERLGRENLFGYWYFVRQHLFARTNRIIPELERWIPGCGVRLIKQGFDIFSQFGTLQPEQLLELYLQFISWPEFTNSSFLSAVEKFQTRLELTDEPEENFDVEKPEKNEIKT